MNNFFFKIECKIKLTDILNILKVPRIDFLNVNKKINKNIENIFIKDFVSLSNLKKDKLSFFYKIDHLVNSCSKYPLK